MKAITISLIIVFLLGGIYTQAQTVPQNTGSDVTQEDAQEALDFHNKVRRDVSCPPLKWDVKLAEYAQQWAEFLAQKKNCTLMHRASLRMDTRTDTGENIFGGFGREYTALDASMSWYSEINEYTYRTVTEANYYNTGHYTQMIWKSSKKIGIGLAHCSDGGIIIVANYSPAGNYIGQKPY